VYAFMRVCVYAFSYAFMRGAYFPQPACVTVCTDIIKSFLVKL
jgi:hypothetical protein